MISLRSILLEVYGKPKAIILAGAGGVGKTSLADVLKPHIPSNFKIFNPDTFNPEDDPQRPNVIQNSKNIRTKAIPSAVENKESFVYDTTGQNFEETSKVIFDAQKVGYDVMMIMLYASPIVTFLRNFSRERKIEKSSILNSWAKVYGLMDDYKSIPNLEFILVQSPVSAEETQQVKQFEQAYKSGDLEEYFKDLLKSNPEKFKSSFRKNKIQSAEDLPDPETLQKREKKKKEYEKKFSDAIKYVKEQFKEVEKYLKIIKPTDYKGAISAVKTFAKP
jgi:hypothetical protein